MEGKDESSGVEVQSAVPSECQCRNCENLEVCKSQVIKDRAAAEAVGSLPLPRFPLNAMSVVPSHQ